METASTYPLGFFLKRAQYSYRTRIDTALRPLGLTAPQFAVLAAVESDPGISNAELARAAFITPQSMQGVLANLERGGFMTRSPHPGHGRILRTQLTSQGRGTLAEARSRVQEIEELLADALGEADMGSFVDMLARCAARLSAD